MTKRQRVRPRAEHVSSEEDDHGVPFTIVKKGTFYRCTRCDEMDQLTENRQNPTGVGTDESDWQEHADMVHRSTANWQYLKREE